MQVQTNSCGRFSPTSLSKQNADLLRPSDIFCVLRPHLGQSNASPSLLDDRHWRHATHTLWKQGLKCCKDTESCDSCFTTTKSTKNSNPFAQWKMIEHYVIQDIHQRLLEHPSRWLWSFSLDSEATILNWPWPPTQLKHKSLTDLFRLKDWNFHPSFWKWTKIAPETQDFHLMATLIERRLMEITHAHHTAHLEGYRRWQTTGGRSAFRNGEGVFFCFFLLGCRFLCTRQVVFFFENCTYITDNIL